MLDKQNLPKVGTLLKDNFGHEYRIGWYNPATANKEAEMGVYSTNPHRKGWTTKNSGSYGYYESVGVTFRLTVALDYFSVVEKD